MVHGGIVETDGNTVTVFKSAERADADNVKNVCNESFEIVANLNRRKKMLAKLFLHLFFSRESTHAVCNVIFFCHFYIWKAFSPDVSIPGVWSFVAPAAEPSDGSVRASIEEYNS